MSRQIQALEEVLGSPLFTRERQTVALTTAGEVYLQEIRAALERISTATLGFSANPKGGTLNLAILPTFGTRWLAPRLPMFLAENPGITINLTTRLARFDFQLEPLDAAIHFGRSNWPGAELDMLMSESVVPACSPAFRKAHRLRKAADLAAVPLLHLISRPEAWKKWFEAQRVNAPTAQGMFFDQFAVIAQAAISGMGVALLPKLLIEIELSRGDLVEVVKAPMKSDEQYFLAWPKNQRVSSA